MRKVFFCRGDLSKILSLCTVLYIFLFIWSVSVVNAEEPWEIHYKQNMKDDLSQYETMEKLLHEGGIKSILDIWSQAFQKAQINQRMFDGLSHHMSYQEVNDKSKALAAYFQKNYTKGDCVALLMPSCPQLAMVFIAAVRAGLVPMIVLTTGKAGELGRKLADHMKPGQPKCVIGLRAYTRAIREAQDILRRESVEGAYDGRDVEYILSGIYDAASPEQSNGCFECFVRCIGSTEYVSGAKSLGDVIEAGSGYHFFESDIDLDSEAFIQFTSGATDKPKAIKITHRNLIANVLQFRRFIEEKMGEKSKSVIFQPLPIAHAFGLIMTCAITPLIGGTAYLVADPHKPENLLKAITQVRPDIVIGADSILATLSSGAYGERLSRLFANNRLLLTLAGVSSVSEPTREAWYNATKCCVTEVYGMSEATVGIAMEITKQDLEYKSTGLVPVPYLYCAVVPFNRILPDKYKTSGFTLSDIQLKPGELGELVVAGDNIAPGYLENPEATEEDFILDSLGRRFFFTGDLVRFDGNGTFRVEGRANETIIVEGNDHVSPASLESTILGHSRVKEAIVFGVPKNHNIPAGDEHVVMVVVMKPGWRRNLTRTNIRNYLKNKLNDNVLPCHEMIIVKDSSYSIPVTRGLRKPKRAQLKKIVCESIRSHAPASNMGGLDVVDCAPIVREAVNNFQ